MIHDVTVLRVNGGREKCGTSGSCAYAKLGSAGTARWRSGEGGRATRCVWHAMCVCVVSRHTAQMLKAVSCCWVHRQQQLGVGTCSNSASGRGGPDHRWCSFSILNILQIYLISFSLRNISFLLITGLPLSRDVAQSDDDVSPKCSFKTKTETRIRSPGTTFQSRAS